MRNCLYKSTKKFLPGTVQNPMPHRNCLKCVETLDLGTFLCTACNLNQFITVSPI